MLEKKYILPIIKKYQWILHKDINKKILTEVEIQSILKNLIDGLYNGYSENIDFFIKKVTKQKLTEETLQIMLQLILLSSNFIHIWYAKLKQKNFLERHSIKIKYNFYFKSIVSEDVILELIDSGIFIDSLLSYTLSILYNKESLISNNNLRIFIKYIFRKDVLLEWSEIISLQKDKSKKCAINFESSEIITNKNNDIDIISDTFLDLDLLFLEKISLQEFFIKAIHFEKEKQRILINLKSHDILKHFINQIPDKSIINLTYNNNEKETYSLFHTLNDEFELKKFIIQNNAAYLCDLLLTQSNSFDSEYVQALIICEDNITKIEKQLINLINSSYLQLFLKKISTFTKFCDNIKNSSEISPIILLKNIDYDENYIEKYKIFQEYFKYDKTFLEEFIKFLDFYFNTKKFPVDNAKLFSEIFTVRRENLLKPFYVSLIKHDPDLFVDFLFKEEVIYDTFFIDCVMLLCNICDFRILEKIKNFLKRFNLKTIIGLLFYKNH